MQMTANGVTVSMQPGIAKRIRLVRDYVVRCVGSVIASKFLVQIGSLTPIRRRMRIWGCDYRQLLLISISMGTDFLSSYSL
ncbi:hypothetical protein CGCF415_v014275 [Colletotrichum fructicola]|nr:hypothetical protein CGCFRS4_v012325 [Colletotrichum fructicola]KAF4888930.1 hypothetical protein CGCF415_v014275 [Colletotrichum fructicola]KAF4934765.1 hypothetical protein CGCF245_v008303 [Colletotrichum fructicola]